MSLILAGRDVPCGAAVRDWRETGLDFAVGRDRGVSPRHSQIDTIVLHWTGAENPPESVHRTLRQRKLGVEFAIDTDGVITQFCDPAVVDAHDCGRAWDRRSVGVEIVSYGFRWPPWRRWSLLPVPRAGRDRALLETHWMGRRCYVAAFYAEQEAAVLALVDALRSVYPAILPVVPRDVSGAILDRPMTPTEAKAWQGGVLGHMHITTRGKPDPGVPLIEEVATHLARCA